MENARNFIFGKFGLKIIVFENHNHHILMHFVLKFQCFELILNVFSKTVFFLKFGEPLPISIYPFCFSIDRKFLIFLRESLCLFQSIETRETCFLKSQIGLFRGTFSKSFSNFPLSPTWLRLHQ